MYPNQRLSTPQQQPVRHYADNTDFYAMFNLLTGPQLFDRSSNPDNYRDHASPHAWSDCVTDLAFNK